MKIYEELLKLNRSGKNSVLITVIDKKGHGPARVGFKLLLTKDGETIGTVGGGELEYLAIQRGINVFKDQKNTVQEYYLGDSEAVINVDMKKTKMICGGSVTLFFEFNGADDTVYIFGAGHVGEAIIYHINRMNYNAVLIDNREEFLNKFKDKIPVFSDFISLKKDKGIKKNSFFIMVTHSHEIDYSILKSIISEDCKPQYIGMIASKKKSKTILLNIKNDHSGNADIDKIKTPIGLNIGGNTADEIAISIIAELQMIKYKKEALRWE